MAGTSPATTNGGSAARGMGKGALSRRAHAVHSGRTAWARFALPTLLIGFMESIY
jgi:hypothetical protein